MIRFLQGDCRDVLKTLPDASVHTVVTSPPYYGLRDYGTAAWSGGDAGCDHVVGAITHSLGLAELGERYAGGGHKASEPKPMTAKSRCPKCGALRVDSQIGLEATPELFVAELVAVFREVWRVLRDDGTVWVNIGDSYNNFRVSKGPGQAVHGRDKLHGKPAPDSGGRGWIGAKEKDLLMIPARLALALQADGWFIRSQLPWVKRGCMPESATDRPGSAVEYVFLLTKRAHYFWDAEAVKRVGSIKDGTRAAKGSNVRSQIKEVNGRPPEYWDYTGERNFRNGDLFFESIEGPHGAITDDAGDIIALDVNTAPFSAAHFATFPPKLITPLILASTSEKGCCPGCGAPWVRQTARIDQGYDGSRYGERAVAATGGAKSGGTRMSTLGSSNGKLTGKIVTAGWQPTCNCPPTDPVPCTILDPFSGSGTTAMVADRLGRDAIGIDLSNEYGEMARDRVVQDAGLFAVIQS